MDSAEKNKADWEGLYGRPISDDEYREICSNLRGFFDLLREWDKESNGKADVLKNNG